MALTGDAANADPVCTLSPFRGMIDEALREHAEAGTDLDHHFVLRQLSGFGDAAYVVGVGEKVLTEGLCRGDAGFAQLPGPV
jgi:hypothetical protein